MTETPRRIPTSPFSGLRLAVPMGLALWALIIVGALGAKSVLWSGPAEAVAQADDGSVAAVEPQARP
jgi:hypothetical protein